jgi:hypothetical protein
MPHPSAVLATPPANPVVVVCWAGEDVRPNDAVFLDRTKHKRGGPRFVSKVSTAPPAVNGTHTFVGYAMTSMDAGNPNREITVGVAGAFTTHADPADIARLTPGDYLTMGPPSPERFLDHAESFHPPSYTLAVGSTYSPVRFLRQETASTMRVLIIKGRRPQTHAFSNKGRVRRPSWQHVTLSVLPPLDLVWGLNTFNDPVPATVAGNLFNAVNQFFGNDRTSVHRSSLDDLSTWQAVQHGWRVFMKMKDWGPNQLVHGPGLLDINGYQTGVFTMLSPALKMPGQAPEPFLLMVDNQNAVRLVTAASVLAGVPKLMQRQQHGQPYVLTRVTEAQNAADNYDFGGPKVHGQLDAFQRMAWPAGRETFTQESVFIWDMYQQMCKDLGQIWQAIFENEMGENDGIVLGGNRTALQNDARATWAAQIRNGPGYYAFSTATENMTAQLLAWKANIEEFEAKTSNHFLTDEMHTFLTALKDEWFVEQNITDGGVTMPKITLTTAFGVTNPIRPQYSFSGADGEEWKIDPFGLRDGGVNIAVLGIGEMSAAERYTPNVVNAGRAYPGVEQPIDRDYPLPAALVVPNLKYRIWGLCDCWSVRDLNPNNVLKDLPLPEYKNWSMNEHYVPDTPLVAIPPCTRWVDKWAQVDPVLRTQNIGGFANDTSERNYRNAAPKGVDPTAHPLGVTASRGGVGWVATQAMGGAAEE